MAEFKIILKEIRTREVLVDADDENEAVEAAVSGGGDILTDNTVDEWEVEQIS